MVITLRISSFLESVYWGDKLKKKELSGFQASKRGGGMKVILKEEEGRVVLIGEAVTVLNGHIFI